MPSSDTKLAVDMELVQEVVEYLLTDVTELVVDTQLVEGMELVKDI